MNSATHARLDRWVELRDQGMSIPQAAAVLGITRATLDKTLERARRAGDDRGRAPVCIEHDGIDRDAVLSEWDIIGSHDTFEGCARRLGVAAFTLNEILTAARLSGDRRARHPYTYVHRRTA